MAYPGVHIAVSTCRAWRWRRRRRGPEERYLDRELSWLAFNTRVLELAEDPDVPLLEREVPRDLRQQPRRVLHGPGRRSQAPHRGRRRRPSRERTATPRGPRGHARADPRADDTAGELFPRRRLAGAGEGRHRDRPMGRSRRLRAQAAAGAVRRANLPGADSAGRRPGTSVPVHLRALAQPRRRPPESRAQPPSTSPGSRCRRTSLASCRSPSSGSSPSRTSSPRTCPSSSRAWRCSSTTPSG